jgi:hypothetical protein
MSTDAKIAFLRPGQLVSLSVRITGGVHYARRDLPTEAPTVAPVPVPPAPPAWEQCFMGYGGTQYEQMVAGEPIIGGWCALHKKDGTHATFACNGMSLAEWQAQRDAHIAAWSANEASAATVKKWETVKTTEDAAEVERATVARAKCRSLIGSVCAHTDVGLLCPADKADALTALIAEARAVADAHNATAKCTRIAVFVLRAQVSETDSEATRAIAAELLAALAGIKSSILALDVKGIRAAAAQAKNVEVMLDQRSAIAPVVSSAIASARATAKEIVKAIKEGATRTEGAVTELAAIEAAEMKLLEVDGAAGESTVSPATLPGWSRTVAPLSNPLDIN